MSEIKIKTKSLMCGMIIILQLMWLQTSILLPKIGGSVYQLIYYMKYLGTFVLVLYVLSKPRSKERENEYKQFLSLFSPLLLLVIIVELVAFATSPVVESYGMSYITRAVAGILDKVCIILMVGCIYSLEGNKTIDFMTTVFLCDEVLLLIVKTLQVGPMRILMPLLSGFGVQNAMESPLEVHEITYCLGFCVIYYFYFKKEKSKGDILKILCLLFFILLGGKRIAILGIMVAGIFCLFVYKKGLSKRMLTFIGCGIIAIEIVYLIILYNGDFFVEILSLNVNSMGRDVIYNYFISRTKFGPDFLGYGISAVSKMIENWTRADVGNMVNVKGLHNDILKIYIDTGFWGIVGWLTFHYVYLPRKIINRYGKKSATFYMALSIYAVITYMTDNTEGYFVFQVTLFIFAFAYSICQLKWSRKE